MVIFLTLCSYHNVVTGFLFISVVIIICCFVFDNTVPLGHSTIISVHVVNRYHQCINIIILHVHVGISLSLNYCHDNNSGITLPNTVVKLVELPLNSH